MPDVKQFHEQVKRGELDAVRKILAEEPSLLDAQNESGQSPFLLAKYYGQAAVAEYLLSLNPRLDVFQLAVAGRRDEVLEALRTDPALFDAYSGDGWTLLHLAAFFGHAQLASDLLAAGFAVDSRSTNAMQNTPLHAAIAGKNTAAARVLLERQADVNARQHGGWTALHGAAQSGDRAQVELLLAYKADVNARAENNQSPLDLALLKGHHEVAALLDELGAKLQ